MCAMVTPVRRGVAEEDDDLFTMSDERTHGEGEVGAEQGGSQSPPIWCASPTLTAARITTTRRVFRTPWVAALCYWVYGLDMMQAPKDGLMRTSLERRKSLRKRNHREEERKARASLSWKWLFGLTIGLFAFFIMGPFFSRIPIAEPVTCSSCKVMYSGLLYVGVVLLIHDISYYLLPPSATALRFRRMPFFWASVLAHVTLVLVAISYFLDLPPVLIYLGTPIDFARTLEILMGTTVLNFSAMELVGAEHGVLWRALFWCFAYTVPIWLRDTLHISPAIDGLLSLVGGIGLLVGTLAWAAILVYTIVHFGVEARRVTTPLLIHMALIIAGPAVVLAIGRSVFVVVATLHFFALVNCAITPFLMLRAAVILSDDREETMRELAQNVSNQRSKLIRVLGAEAGSHLQHMGTSVHRLIGTLDAALDGRDVAGGDASPQRRPADVVRAWRKLPGARARTPGTLKGEGSGGEGAGGGVGAGAMVLGVDSVQALSRMVWDLNVNLSLAMTTFAHVTLFEAIMAGRLNLVPRPLSVDGIISRTRRIQRKEAMDHGVRVRFRFTSHAYRAPIAVVGDSHVIPYLVQTLARQSWLSVAPGSSVHILLHVTQEGLPSGPWVVPRGASSLWTRTSVASRESPLVPASPMPSPLPPASPGRELARPPLPPSRFPTRISEHASEGALEDSSGAEDSSGSEVSRRRRRVGVRNAPSIDIVVPDDADTDLAAPKTTDTSAASDDRSPLSPLPPRGLQRRVSSDRVPRPPPQAAALVRASTEPTSSPSSDPITLSRQTEATAAGVGAGTAPPVPSPAPTGPVSAGGAAGTTSAPASEGSTLLLAEADTERSVPRGHSSGIPRPGSRPTLQVPSPAPTPLPAAAGGVSVAGGSPAPRFTPSTGHSASPSGKQSGSETTASSYLTRTMSATDSLRLQVVVADSGPTPPQTILDVLKDLPPRHEDGSALETLRPAIKHRRLLASELFNCLWLANLAGGSLRAINLPYAFTPEGKHLLPSAPRLCSALRESGATFAFVLDLPATTVAASTSGST